MKYIYTTTVGLLTLILLTSIKGIPKTVSKDSPRSQTGVISTGVNHSREIDFIHSTPAEEKDSVSKTSIPVAPIVAVYRQGDHAWTFFAKVLGLRDVSIYGRPGTIARIEYMRDQQPTYAWAVINIDDYYFSDSAQAFAEGQEIMLEVSGEHVSSQGVNWDGCPHGEEYCQYASFIEGGFPVSEDYNGLTMCPSNMLIYSGYVSDDWINGLLAWKIKILPAKAAQDCTHCPSDMQLDYFP